MDTLFKPRRASEAESNFLSVSVFTSLGTHVCCALPAALVAIGAGAALASLVGAVPQLVWLVEHNVGLFTAAGTMLAIAGVFQWRARFAPCPADPALAAACMRQRRMSAAVYAVAPASLGSPGHSPEAP